MRLFVRHLTQPTLALRYGTADRSLWVQTLSYFAGKEADCRDQIKEVLAHIDRRNLLPPLMVVDALARNSTATLAVVKDYITRRLSHENQNIAEDERLIRQYRQDTKRMQGEIETLKSEATVFQDMKCAYSNRRDQSATVLARHGLLLLYSTTVRLLLCT